MPRPTDDRPMGCSRSLSASFRYCFPVPASITSPTFSMSLNTSPFTVFRSFNTSSPTFSMSLNTSSFTVFRSFNTSSPAFPMPLNTFSPTPASPPMESICCFSMSASLASREGTLRIMWKNFSLISPMPWSLLPVDRKLSSISLMLNWANRYTG